MGSDFSYRLTIYRQFETCKHVRKTFLVEINNPTYICQQCQGDRPVECHISNRAFWFPRVSQPGQSWNLLTYKRQKPWNLATYLPFRGNLRTGLTQGLRNRKKIVCQFSVLQISFPGFREHRNQWKPTETWKLFARFADGHWFAVFVPNFVSL